MEANLQHALHDVQTVLRRYFQLFLSSVVSANCHLPIVYPAVVLSSNKRQLVQYDPCFFASGVFHKNTLWCQFDIITL